VWTLGLDGPDGRSGNGMCFQMRIVNRRGRWWLAALGAALALLNVAVVGAQDTGMTEARVCMRQAQGLLAEAGALESSPSVEGFLAAGEVSERRVILEAGSCLTWLAIPGGALTDLDIGFYGEDGGLLARDVASDLPPLVRFCSAETSSITVAVHAFRGVGPFIAAGWTDAPADVNDRLQGIGGCFAGAASPSAPQSELGSLPRTMGQAEVAAVEDGHTRPSTPREALRRVWSARGLRPAAVRRVSIGGGRSQESFQVVASGSCSALGAATESSDDAETWVDIVVVDLRGRRLGWDLRRLGWGSVYVCGRAGETVRVRLRGRGRDSEVVFYQGVRP